jgi:hypothetical protein
MSLGTNGGGLHRGGLCAAARCLEINSAAFRYSSTYLSFPITTNHAIAAYHCSNTWWIGSAGGPPAFLLKLMSLSGGIRVSGTAQLAYRYSPTQWSTPWGSNDSFTWLTWGTSIWQFRTLIVSKTCHGKILIKHSVLCRKTTIGTPHGVCATVLDVVGLQSIYWSTSK